METSIKARVSEELKREAAEVLHDCGLNVSTAIRLFLEQVVKSGGLPFEVRRYPSESMKTALKATAEIEASGKEQHSSLEDMFKGMNHEIEGHQKS